MRGRCGWKGEKHKGLESLVALLGGLHVHLHARAFLELEEQGGVFDLDEGVDVLESSLHEGEFGLDGVVAVGDVLADGLFGAGDEGAGEQFDELVLHILDEV